MNLLKQFPNISIIIGKIKLTIQPQYYLIERK